MKRIVALDPGGTTGWALWQAEPLPQGFGPNKQFTCGQLDRDNHHEDLYDLLCTFQTHDFTVISESFEFRQHDNHRNNVNLMSREYIGVAKLFVKQRQDDLHSVVLQSPGTVKPFVTDQKLKVMDLWVPGKQHARDALRHLVWYLVNRERQHDLIQSWRTL